MVLTNVRIRIKQIKEGGYNSMKNQFSKMPAQALYGELRAIVEGFPDFTYGSPVTDDRLRWMGRAQALVGQALGASAETEFMFAQQYINTMSQHEKGVEGVKTLVFKALATVEFELPPGERGTFIPAGNVFDAMARVASLFSGAASDVLIIDPYLDEKFMTEFALLANEGISMRLLRDAHQLKPSLLPLKRTWTAQHGARRPLEIRIALARTLHDRLIIVDNKSVWNVGQSFNNLAGRAPTSFVQTDPETADLKIIAYEAIWKSASPL